MENQLQPTGPSDICPICLSSLHWYNINFKDMLQMCQNKNCEYPFGYTDLNFKADEDLLSDEELDCTSSVGLSTWQSVSCSLTDNTFDDRETSVSYETYEDEAIDVNTYINSDVRVESNATEREDPVDKELQYAAKLKEKFIGSNAYKEVITNPKLLKNMYKMHKVSKVKLLSDAELALAAKEEKKKTNQNLVNVKIVYPSDKNSLLKIDFVPKQDN